MARRSGTEDPGELGTRARPRATVLHIDDDPNDTELFGAAVAKAGLDVVVHTVEDADQAMDYLRGRGIYGDRSRYPVPNLILLDLRMPRATGLEVLQWVRANAELGAVPVVVLSGSELSRDREAAYAAGANSYLLKPFSLGGLVDVVQRIWEEWLADCLVCCRAQTHDVRQQL